MASSVAQSSASASEAENAARDPLSIPAEVKSSIRILVIDDERTLRESCATVLKMDGFNVTLIGRGEEALDGLIAKANAATAAFAKLRAEIEATAAAAATVDAIP